MAYVSIIGAVGQQYVVVYDFDGGIAVPAVGVVFDDGAGWPCFTVVIRYGEGEGCTFLFKIFGDGAVVVPGHEQFFGAGDGGYAGG